MIGLLRVFAFVVSSCYFVIFMFFVVLPSIRGQCQSTSSKGLHPHSDSICLHRHCPVLICTVDRRPDVR